MRWLALCLVLSIAACATDDPSAPGCTAIAPDAGGALPMEVVDVLERNCWGCHGDPTMRFAPMKLVEWADFQVCRSDAQQVPVYERMRLRIHSPDFPMPPIREPQLSEEDLAILDAWVESGAPVASD